MYLGPCERSAMELFNVLLAVNGRRKKDPSKMCIRILDTPLITSSYGIDHGTASKKSCKHKEYQISGAQTAFSSSFDTLAIMMQCISEMF